MKRQTITWPWVARVRFWAKKLLVFPDAVSSAPIFITRRVGGSSWHGKWGRSEYALTRLVGCQNGLVSPWGRGLSNPEAPLFSWLRLFLFTSRFSRGCGFVCSPAVLLALLRLCLFTSPFNCHLIFFFVENSYQVFKRSSFACRF